MKLKISVVLLLFALIFNQGIAQESEKVFNVVEEMPRFPGCENMEGTNMEKKQCADKKMLEYIYKNLKIPKTVKENGIECNCVVSFIIEKDGSISDIKVIRGVGIFSEEVVRLVENMPTWRAGKHRNQNVRVKIILPVRVNLK
ncbi:MAG: energy transducer TonB [Saprospiraceae bacterium]